MKGGLAYVEAAVLLLPEYNKRVPDDQVFDGMQEAKKSKALNDTVVKLEGQERLEKKEPKHKAKE